MTKERLSNEDRLALIDEIDQKLKRIQAERTGEILLKLKDVDSSTFKIKVNRYSFRQYCKENGLDPIIYEQFRQRLISGVVTMKNDKYKKIVKLLRNGK